MEATRTVEIQRAPVWLRKINSVGSFLAAIGFFAISPFAGLGFIASGHALPLLIGVGTGVVGAVLGLGSYWLSIQYYRRANTPRTPHTENVTGAGFAPFPHAPKWVVVVFHVFAFAFVIFGILTFLSVVAHTTGSIVMPAFASITVASLVFTMLTLFAGVAISTWREPFVSRQPPVGPQAQRVQRQPVASAVILLRLQQLQEIRATTLRDIAGEFRGGRVIKLDD